MYLKRTLPKVCAEYSQFFISHCILKITAFQNFHWPKMGREVGFSGMKSALPLFPGSRVPRFPCSSVPLFPGSPVHRFPRSPVPRFPRSSVPQFPCSPVPPFPGSPVPPFPGSPVPQFPGSPVPRFPCSPVPPFPGSPVPRFPCSPVPRFPSSPVPRFPVPCFKDSRSFIIAQILRYARNRSTQGRRSAFCFRRCPKTTDIFSNFSLQYEPRRETFGQTLYQSKPCFKVICSILSSVFVVKHLDC